METPLGKENPNQAELAAKYVKQAINLVIPREKIIEELTDGFGTVGTTIFAPHLSGVSQHLEPYEYSPAKAIELLEMAGYTQETEAPTSIVKESENNDGFLILNPNLIVFPLILIAIRIILFRKKAK